MIPTLDEPELRDTEGAEQDPSWIFRIVFYTLILIYSPVRCLPHFWRRLNQRGS